jgi:predicted dehydrogenase
MNVAVTKSNAQAAVTASLRVAVVGIGWWSDVLADAIERSNQIEVAACFTRSEEKRTAFAAKYGCRAAPSYEDILADDSIAAIVNTTPNNVHLETTRMAAQAGKHVFLDKPIANTVAEGREISRVCEAAGVVLALGYQRRREGHFRWIKAEIDAGRFGRLVQAECNISRDRLGKIDLSSWRYQAAGMPGGVMLQIGIHYVDVLEMLLGPVKRVAGMAAQLVLPGDNPDVASLMLEHEGGAISNLTASYASASEYYMMKSMARRPAPITTCSTACAACAAATRNRGWWRWKPTTPSARSSRNSSPACATAASPRPTAGGRRAISR